MPNYFYLGYSYIRVTTNLMPGSNTVVVSFDVEDETQLAKCVDCPSVCLFYILDNDSLFESNKAKIKSLFSSQYGAESNRGAILSISSDDVTEVIEKFTPSDDSQVSISIYPLAFANGDEVSMPSYHVPILANEDGSPATNEIRFALSYNPVAKTLTLLRPAAVADPIENWQASELIRSGGGRTFLEIAQAADFDEYKSRCADMGAVKDKSLVKLHVMAALCATRGSFDNFYLSRLYELNNAVFDLT